MAVASYTVATAVAMLLFVLLLNVTVAWYGRGVVRAALDEGVRAAARADGSLDACRQHVGRVVDQLLGGAFTQGVDWECATDGGQVNAVATVTVAGWLGVPDWTFDLAATAAREPRL